MLLDGGGSRGSTRTEISSFFFFWAPERPGNLVLEMKPVMTDVKDVNCDPPQLRMMGDIQVSDQANHRRVTSAAVGDR